MDIDIDKDRVNQVKEYVYKNYKTYFGMELYVVEYDTHFSVKKHIDGAPLVLGKSILS